MRQHEIESLLTHMWGLYPKAAERWPKARQQAFKDQLGSLKVELNQARAVVNDVAMNSKSSWAPPESEILKRLRGLVASQTVERETTDRQTRSGPQPGDRTLREWNQHFLDNPSQQECWTDEQRRGFSMMLTAGENNERSAKR